jgi:hypothetical protein
MPCWLRDVCTENRIRIDCVTDGWTILLADIRTGSSNRRVVVNSVRCLLTDPADQADVVSAHKSLNNRVSDFLSRAFDLRQ